MKPNVRAVTFPGSFADESGHGGAFVAKDIRLTVAYFDHQAATAINIGDVLVRDNRQVVEVWIHGP